jgi:hypothetical protein
MRSCKIPNARKHSDLSHQGVSVECAGREETYQRVQPFQMGTKLGLAASGSHGVESSGAFFCSQK